MAVLDRGEDIWVAMLGRCDDIWLVEDLWVAVFISLVSRINQIGASTNFFDLQQKKKTDLQSSVGSP